MVMKMIREVLDSVVTPAMVLGSALFAGWGLWRVLTEVLLFVGSL
jgi:hypothetical protein